MRQRIAIVGGGIAGLSLGAALDPRRFEVIVHEAQPGRADAGGALGLWPAALRALGRIGARRSVETAGGRPAVGSLFRITGEPLVSGRASLVMAPRPALLAALGAALPPAVRVEASEITDPALLDADLVIGADGVRSRVRGLVHPAAAERNCTPYVALRGLVTDRVPTGAVGEYWGPGVLFGLVPVRPGLTYWFTSHRSDLGPEPLDVGDVLAEARQRFAGAAPVVRDIVGRAGSDTSATRIWTAPPMPRYVRGRYVVIGDAAHAMTPNLGRGACDAIVDAVTLATAIEDGRLGRWQVRRLPFTQSARMLSGSLMRLALLDRGSGLRDKAIGLIPGP